MRLIAPNLTKKDLIDSLESIVFGMPHWYEQMLSDLSGIRERLSALKTVVYAEDFNPYKLMLACTVFRERYFCTGESFLISSSSLDDPRLHKEEMQKNRFTSYSRYYTKVSINQPAGIQELEAVYGISYAFMESHRGGHLQEYEYDKVNNVKAISYPVIIMPDDIIAMLSDKGLLDRFNQHFGKVLQATNHDFLHSYTNNQLLNNMYGRNLGYAEICGGWESDFSKSVGILEEDIVLAMNAEIYQTLLQQGGGKFIDEFFAAIDGAIELLDEMKVHDYQMHFALKALLKYMLSNYVERGYLDKTDYHEWPEEMRTKQAGHYSFTLNHEGEYKYPLAFFHHISKVIEDDIENWFVEDKPLIDQVSREMVNAALKGRANTRQYELRRTA